MTFSPSPQQAAAIDWVTNGNGSAFMEAVAGAGKTTTIVAAAAATIGRVAIAAYNTAAAGELKARLARSIDANEARRFTVGTFHSFGCQAWRRIHPAVKMGPEAAREKAEMTKKRLLEAGCHESLHGFVLKLVSLAKQRVLGLHGAIDDESRWYEIIEHFDLAYEIEDEEMIAQGVKFAMRALRYQVALGPKIIDFDDMIYLPVTSGVRAQTYDWGFFDEAQDTNPARRALARKLLGPNSRSMWVGDRHQAIYGFTGADGDAVDQIIRDFSCKTLPLTVTYRCPKAVVSEARQIVSHIEAHESAPDGSVRVIPDASEDKSVETLMTQSFSQDDAILCRKTAPLVALAFTLIRTGIPCHVEGKDIGAGLLAILKRFRSARTLPTLLDRLAAYRERECEKLVAKGRETQAEALTDRCETVVAIASRCETIEQLTNQIRSMFQDSEREKRRTLTLATCHRSKGREWDRVFILGYRQYMPSRAARQAWQVEQEHNLRYVAVTRARRELIYVDVTSP